MTSTMRRMMRGAAAGLGALAIVAGTAACGGLLGGGGDETGGGTGAEAEETDGGSSESEESGSDSSESEEGADGAEESEGAGSEDTGSESAESEDAGSGSDESSAEESASEEGGDEAAAGEAITEEDLTAVGDIYYDFLTAVGENDGEAACSLITNPLTGGAMEGTMLSECAKGFEGAQGSAGIDPSILDALERSMIEGVDNGDGTASATLAGQDVGMTFVRAGDGQWLIDGSQFM